MTRRALAFTAAAVVIGACGGDLHLSSAPVPGADAGADGATTRAHCQFPTNMYSRLHATSMLPTFVVPQKYL